MKTSLRATAIASLLMGLALTIATSRPRAEQPAAAPAPEPTVSLRCVLNSIIAFTEQGIQDIERQLSVLAMTETVQSGNWDAMRPLLAAAQKGGTPRVVWYARPDGSYFTVEKGLIDQMISDRAYFPVALSGKAVRGALVISRSTGKKSVVIAVPVTRAGKVSGVLGTALFVEDMSAYLVKTLQLPQGVSFYALAADGSTTIHNDPGLQFIDTRAQDSPTLAAAVGQMLARESGEVTYVFRGAAKRVLYAASPLLGWRFAVGILLK